MITKLKKNKKRKTGLIEKFFKALLTIILLMVIYFLVDGNLKLYYKNKKIEKDYDKFSSQLKELQTKNRELNKLFYQASQRDYLEKVLREKGLYKKPGEKVVVIEEEE